MLFTKKQQLLRPSSFNIIASFSSSPFASIMKSKYCKMLNKCIVFFSLIPVTLVIAAAVNAVSSFFNNERVKWKYYFSPTTPSRIVSSNGITNLILLCKYFSMMFCTPFVEPLDFSVTSLVHFSGFGLWNSHCLWMCAWVMCVCDERTHSKIHRVKWVRVISHNIFAEGIRHEKPSIFFISFLPSLSLFLFHSQSHSNVLMLFSCFDALRYILIKTLRQLLNWRQVSRMGSNWPFLCLCFLVRC